MFVRDDLRAIAGKVRGKVFTACGQDADVVISTDPTHVGYLCGYRSLLFDLMRDYRSAAIVTRDKAVLVTGASDVAAALDHYLAPSGLSLDALRANPRGIRVPLKTSYQKYRDAGFSTPSGKLEIFSSALSVIGEPPLPEFRAPFAEAPGFPLTLTSAKSPLYCHSQHRNLARLRRIEPDPVAELSPATAAARGIGEGDWLAITTLRARVRARARLNATLADGIVAARHGWWQACPELELPGYDALDFDGANINLAIGIEAADPVSGAAPHRCYPCQIEKLR